MKFKSNIKKSLDVLRKEIGNNENMVYSKDSSKKVLLFVNYINNRIENLLKKEVCKNAQIVNDYFILNKVQPSYLNKYLSIDIKDWKKIDITDINIMELCFKHKLEEEKLDNSTVIKYLNLNISSLMSMEYDNEITKIDLRKAFKDLENVNKRITTYHKVHGYLKEIRLKK